MLDRTVPAAAGPAPRLPATAPPEPRLRPTLGYLCRQVEDGHPAVMRDVWLPDPLRDEARVALDSYQRLTATALAPLILDWVAGVNRGLGNPLRGEGFVGWSTEVVGALRGLPVAVFHAGTRAEAQRAFTFQPSAGELFALLDAHARPLQAKAIALRRLLDTKPPPLEKDALTAEEREAIAADFGRRARAAMAEANPEPPGPVAAPDDTYATRPMNREQLRAAYAQQAKSQDMTTATLARTRLAMLGAEVPPAEAVPPESTPPPDEAEIPWHDNRGEPRP